MADVRKLRINKTDVQKDRYPYRAAVKFTYTGSMPLSVDAVKLLCENLLNATVDGVEFPGGSSRESVRVQIGAQRLIVTHRKNINRAKLESAALRILNQHSAPVPHLIAYRDNYLIQQDVGLHRLSQSMKSGNSTEILVLLEAALASLQAVHEAGKNSAALLPLITLGNTPGWLEKFVKSAARLGTALELEAPVLDYDRLTALLTVEQPRFIKWDARPGNAVVRENGSVIWIDWEHCGRRHPLDDVAWLLTDEYTPWLPSADSQMISRIVPAFANDCSQTQAHEYLRVFGTFHSCIRLDMIMRHQEKDGWWDYERCLQLDRMGVVQELAIRVAARAANWAQYSPLTRSLTPWMHAIQDKLEKADS